MSAERKAQEAKDAPRSTLHAPRPDAPRSTLDAPRSTLSRVCAAGLSEGDAAALIAAHERAVAMGEGVLKQGRRTVVTRVTAGGRAFCVKEYRAAGWLDVLKDWLRGPRARRAWRAAAHLAARGIPTPEAVALVERGATGYLVTRFVEGAVPLSRLLETRFNGALPPAEQAAKRALVRQLAQWLRRVHDLGVYHDDWSAKNILTAQAGEQWAFCFLDLESLVPRKHLTYRRRVKNLGQLSDAPFGITRTDRLRFLLAYAGTDRSQVRGRFPRDILAAARRREEEWARVQAAARRRKAKSRESGKRKA